MAEQKLSRRKPRRRMYAYASTGSNCGPWSPMDGDGPEGGRMAIFERYADALKDSFGPHMVHRVEIFIEREPAKP